jgi:hypothetical protein
MSSRGNPLKPFNDVIAEAITAEKPFFHRSDGTYDTQGILLSLTHRYTVNPPVVFGVSLYDALLAAYLKVRHDYYFRTDRITSGPAQVKGMRRTIRYPNPQPLLPGMEAYITKDFIDAEYDDLRYYRQFMADRRDEIGYRVDYVDEVIARMVAAGATMATDPVLPHLTDEERQALS